MKELQWDKIKRILLPYDWRLLCFLVLVLNVKLVVKIIVLLVFFLVLRKDFSVRLIIKQRFAWFYLAMILIGSINFVLQLKAVTVPYTVVTVTGLLFWGLSAIASYEAYMLIQKSTVTRTQASFDLFFTINLIIVLLHLLWIMIDAGTLNPYTYKGLNQKYYVSTGDYIRGITFDSPVTTAMICAFGLLYFLYREKYLLTVLSMGGLLVVSSNLTDIFIVLILLLVFVFRSDKVQKSIIVVCMTMFLAFMVKVSPQNNELVVSLLYKIIDKPYYLPPVKIITNEALKQMPDSVLDAEQRNRKTGLLYIDSISGITMKTLTVSPGVLHPETATKNAGKIFYEYRATKAVKDKENRFAVFVRNGYDSTLKDSLTISHNWELPGKWLALKNTIHFFNTYPGAVWLGAGMGNFSSRLAFKATGLGMAGGYPSRFGYIHPFFMNGHLFIYLYYHAQWQIKHSASNTPDAVYMQLAGEYGLIGLLCFFVLYVTYFLRRIRFNGFAWSILLLLLSSLWVEYWFEQLSVVILFELLMLANIKMQKENAHHD